MGSILQRLEEWNKSETIAKTARKELRNGEIWVYPMELKKGVKYSISGRCPSAATIKCSLFNGCEGPVCESEAVKRNALSVVPENDGLHELKVMQQSAPSDSGSRKVTVTLKKASVPSRIRAWLGGSLDFA
jgi:hypothetical protein